MVYFLYVDQVIVKWWYDYLVVDHWAEPGVYAVLEKQGLWALAARPNQAQC